MNIDAIDLYTVEEYARKIVVTVKKLNDGIISNIDARRQIGNFIYKLGDAANIWEDC